MGDDRRHRSRGEAVIDLRNKLKNRRQTRDRSRSRNSDLRKRRRSRSPLPRRPSVDERKSYLKFLSERDNLTEQVRDRSREEASESKKKKKKKHKHKHKKEKEKEKEKRKKDRSSKERKHHEHEETRSKRSNGAAAGAGVEKELNDVKAEVEPDARRLDQDQEVADVGKENPVDEKNVEVAAKSHDSNMESDFDDFVENELSSMSSSSLSLSSIDDADQDRVSAPIDYGPWGRRPSDSTSIPARSPARRTLSRSRSRSRPFESRTSRSISISPPGREHSWEMRVSDFIRSVGGNPVQASSITFLESVATISAPVHISSLPPPYVPIGQPPRYLNSYQPAPSVGGQPTFHAVYPPPVGVPPPVHCPPSHASLAPAEPKAEPEATNEEESTNEDFTSTPLIKFVGQKLADKKLASLASLKAGFFRFNLLTVASRGEWVARRVINSFDKSGFTESKLYDMAALKGQQGFKDYLVDALASKKVEFGVEKLTKQDTKLIHRVIDLIVKYFTFDGSVGNDDGDAGNENEFEDTDEEGSDNKVQAQVPSRGLADFVKNLVADAEKVPEVSPAPEQPPVNPWSNMWNWMQSENYKTFLELKNNLAKGLMGSGNTKFGKDPFKAAQDLVSCWVVAGNSFNFCLSLVDRCAAPSVAQQSCRRAGKA